MSGCPYRYLLSRAREYIEAYWRSIYTPACWVPNAMMGAVLCATVFVLLSRLTPTRLARHVPLYSLPASAECPKPPDALLCSTAFSRTVRRACGVHAKRGKNRTKSEQGLESLS